MFQSDSYMKSVFLCTLQDSKLHSHIVFMPMNFVVELCRIVYYYLVVFQFSTVFLYHFLFTLSMFCADH